MGVTLDMFKKETEGRKYEAGEVIFAAGDKGDAMYVIIEGEVELKIGTFSETLGPGEPFGEMALIDHSPRVATAMAKTACQLVAIPEKRFLYLVQQTPYFSLQIMTVMADRLRRTDARLSALMSKG